MSVPRNWEVWKSWAEERMAEPGLAEQLRRWLSGDELPMDDPTVEAQDWILQAIPLGNAGEVFRKGVTEAAAELLRNGDKNGSAFEKYGLLELAAALSKPETLASALDEFLERTNLREMSYRGLPLTVAARYALRWNQIDQRWFEPVWAPMVRGDEQAVRWGVSGTRMDGVDGVTAMPLDQSKLGWALIEIARQWEGDEDRSSKRDRLFERAKSGNPAIDSDLLLMALVDEKAPEWLLDPWLELAIAGVEKYSGWSLEAAAAHVRRRAEETLRRPGIVGSGGRGRGFLIGAALHSVPKSAAYRGTQQDIYDEALAVT